MILRLFASTVFLSVLTLTGCLHETAISGQLPDTNTLSVSSQRIEISSDGQTYPAYFVQPESPGNWPGIVLLHSINGLQQGYVDLSDQLAAAGYAVLTMEWQTYARVPHDDATIQLVRDGISFLRSQPNVDGQRLGLTGFCIGGRYTMLMQPQIADFKAGVAWYGFPFRGGDDNQVTQPAEVIDQLSTPMLILHGTADRPSPIADIYEYATQLDAAGKYFEMKIYQAEPHSFVLNGDQLSSSSAAQDAIAEMISFFDRML